jgi:hypothetical protein
MRRIKFSALAPMGLCNILFALLLSIAWSASAQSIPVPPIFMSIDLADATSSVEERVRITERRSYSVDLNIFYSSQDDMPNIRKIAGDGARYPDGRYSDPGTTVRMHLRIVAEDGDARGKVLFDKTIATEGHYSHGFVQAGGGYYARRIGGAVLAPGIYRVSAATVESVPVLSRIKTNVSVTYDPRL